MFSARQKIFFLQVSHIDNPKIFNRKITNVLIIYDN